MPTVHMLSIAPWHPQNRQDGAIAPPPEQFVRELGGQLRIAVVRDVFHAVCGEELAKDDVGVIETPVTYAEGMSDIYIVVRPLYSASRAAAFDELLVALKHETELRCRRLLDYMKLAVTPTIIVDIDFHIGGGVALNLNGATDGNSWRSEMPAVAATAAA
jgi:hypothetical protein